MIAWAASGIEGPLTLAGAAAHVGLSGGRARHLFVEQTGLPFRAYVLWLRLTKAVQSAGICSKRPPTWLRMMILSSACAEADKADRLMVRQARK